MFQKEGTPPKFIVGSHVRVKKGVVAPNDPDVPLAGRCGILSQVSGAVCLVHWSGATLNAMHSIYRRNDMDDAVWLQEAALEVDPGEPFCIEQEQQIGAGRE
jgi:hypothetical protein